MNKNIFCTLALMALIIFGSAKPIMAQEKVILINSNGVSITQNGYDKLKNMGFVDVEINTIKQEDYDRIQDMNTISTMKEQYFIKTTTTILENGETIIEDESLTKDEIVNEINDEKQEVKQANSNLNKQESQILGFPDKQIVDFPESGGGSEDNNPTETSYATTDYKAFTVTGTYYKNKGKEGTFFVKVNLEWLITPKKRFEDIITINFSNDILPKNEQINGIKVPLVKASLSYKKKISNNSLIDKHLDYDGRDTSMYHLIPHEGIAFKMKLPSVEDCTDFFVSLSCEFVPTQSGTTGATFVGTYQHQTANGNFDWGKIQLSTTSPFVTYSTSYSDSHPVYDTTLARKIMFENL